MVAIALLIAGATLVLSTAVLAVLSAAEASVRSAVPKPHAASS